MKVNLHILENCNYSCKHCFAHFCSKSILPVEQWRAIVDNCMASGDVHAFNIAGGEPLLYPKLEELVDHIKSVGAECSIITNGSLVTDCWVDRYAPKMNTIGFSIDSFSPSISKSIGRVDANGKILTANRFSEICKRLKTINPSCSIKVNTVVSALNIGEQIMETFRIFEIPVDKWKILKMSVFNDDRHSNSDLAITDSEYWRFVYRNVPSACNKPDAQCVNMQNAIVYTLCGTGGNSKMIAIAEPSLIASYVIIDANGHLVDNRANSGYKRIIDCKSESFVDGIRNLNLNIERYRSRYNSACEVKR